MQRSEVTMVGREEMAQVENAVIEGRVTMESPAEEKVALFRRLFRGREDVFARRFESRKTGKSGYQPMCGNEWIRGVCGKPKVRCAACPHRAFVPVSDRTVFWHLRGKDDAGRAFTMGVYPMLPDETVRFAALDFDKASWRDDAAAVREAARELGHEAAVERSRSGNGAHLWFFFEERVAARVARDFVMFDRRCRGYEALGYQVVLPPGAAAGWPADVSLPVDPAWRETHSESIRRLCRDGVDETLAVLFVWAAGQRGTVTPLDARTAALRFLAQRLDTLPETRGRFQSHAKLDISFEANPDLHVDLLDAERRLAIELDAEEEALQPDAYRRARRKDLLLQAAGYRVIRFFAGDVSTRLSFILDDILLFERMGGSVEIHGMDFAHLQKLIDWYK